MPKIPPLRTAVAVLTAMLFQSHAFSLELAGQWTLRLDPNDQGLAQNWAAQRFDDPVWLPGALQHQGYGNPISVDTPWTGSIFDRSYFTDPRYARYRDPKNLKVPFWLQPDRYYKGAAWYQRIVAIPAEWEGKEIELTLERAHWGTHVWLDGREAGAGEALATPHRFDLTALASPGTTQTLTIRVDNRLLFEIGQNAHSVSDQTQTNWNGIVGAMTLEARQPFRIASIKVEPDLKAKQAKVSVRLSNPSGANPRGRLYLSAEKYNSTLEHVVSPVEFEMQFPAGSGSREIAFERDLPMGDQAAPWDEFNPALYRLTARYIAADPKLGTSEAHASFGMREMRVQNKRFTVNGRPVFLRGTLDCAVFPLTGYPPTDVASWKKIDARLKEFGINHVRFHSWCPPEAAFQAADETGIYIQVEASNWVNQGAELAPGQPNGDWIMRESERILAEYGNHPSFVMFAMGNEPAGPGRGADYCKAWLSRMNAIDSQRLFSSAAGWPEMAENDYAITHWPRLHQWKDELNSRLNATPPSTMPDYSDWVTSMTMPIVSHEIGQWCAFPDFDEMQKYTGALRPRNYEIFQDILARQGMSGQARDFLMASGELQKIVYKEEIEAALRTPGFGGFQLLGLQDFSGQGTALVGVLDAFWDPKPYVTGAEWRRFCAPAVLLARLPRRVFSTDSEFSAKIEIANFLAASITRLEVEWSLFDDTGRKWQSGTLAAPAPSGSLSAIGSLQLKIPRLPVPQKLVLHLAADSPGGRIENTYDLWAYPPLSDALPEGISLVSADVPEALAALGRPGKTLVLLPPARVEAPSVIGFTPVFWNTAFTSYQAPHTLGLLLNPRHSLFKGFPSESHSNWQWWDPVKHSSAMVLDGLSPDLHPLIQPIDTWFESRKLGLLFECRIGETNAMVCSIDLSGEMQDRLVSRQLRASILEYMAGPGFSPSTAVSAAQLAGLLKKP